MPRNIEIKARVPDLAAVRTIATRLSGTPARIIAQADTFFVVPSGRLKVREFGDGSGELIAYDRPDDSGPKESVYARVAIDEASALVHALSMVLPVRGQVRKRRELFLVGRTRVHLDEVEGLGAFVELEVVLRDDESAEAGEVEAQDLMKALSISPLQLVRGAYIDLLEDPPGK